MKTLTRSVASAIVAVAFCSANVAALAMPKAAEDESAPVSSGDNAARPKHSSAKPPAVAGPTKPAKKSAKPVKSTKQTKTSPKKTKATRTKK